MKKTNQPAQFWVWARRMVHVAVVPLLSAVIWHKVTGGPALIDENFWSKWLCVFLILTYAMQFVEITNAEIRDLRDQADRIVKATDTVIGDLRDRVDRLEEELEEHRADQIEDFISEARERIP